MLLLRAGNHSTLHDEPEPEPEPEPQPQPQPELEPGEEEGTDGSPCKERRSLLDLEATFEKKMAGISLEVEHFASGRAVQNHADSTAAKPSETGFRVIKRRDAPRVMPAQSPDSPLSSTPSGGQPTPLWDNGIQTPEQEEGSGSGSVRAAASPPTRGSRSPRSPRSPTFHVGDARSPNAVRRALCSAGSGRPTTGQRAVSRPHTAQALLRELEGAGQGRSRSRVGGRVGQAEQADTATTTRRPVSARLGAQPPLFRRFTTLGWRMASLEEDQGRGLNAVALMRRLEFERSRSECRPRPSTWVELPSAKAAKASRGRKANGADAGRETMLAQVRRQLEARAPA